MAARKNGDCTKNNQVEIHRMGEMFKSTACFSTRLEILQKSRMMKMYNVSNRSAGSSLIHSRDMFQNCDIPVVIPNQLYIRQVQEEELEQSIETRAISQVKYSSCGDLSPNYNAGQPQDFKLSSKCAFFYSVLLFIN